MFKIHFLSVLLFISASVVAQSNLVIDSVSIPVGVLERTINLPTARDIDLEIRDRKSDTIITFNPETYADRIEIVATGSGARSVRVKDSGIKLKRSHFLESPLVYLSHNGLQYAAYRCYIFYFREGKYVGLGFDDTVSIGPAYTLRYFKVTTLMDLRWMLREKLPKDVAEIYISGAAFFSVETEEKLFLTDTFKVTLEE